MEFIKNTMIFIGILYTRGLYELVRVLNKAKVAVVTVAISLGLTTSAYAVSEPGVMNVKIVCENAKDTHKEYIIKYAETRDSDPVTAARYYKIADAALAKYRRGCDTTSNDLKKSVGTPEVKVLCNHYLDEYKNYRSLGKREVNTELSNMFHMLADDAWDESSIHCHEASSLRLQLTRGW